MSILTKAPPTQAAQVAGRPRRGRRTEPGRRFIGPLFALPWFLGFAAFYLYPFGSSFYTSLTSATLFGGGDFVGLDNYTELWHDKLIWKSLYNTVYFAVASVLLGTILALVMAVLLARDGRTTMVFRSVFYLPTVVPIVGAAIMWIWILQPQYGLLNSMLRALHLPAPGWFTDPTWAMPSLILMSLWTIGNMMVIFIAGLRDIPLDLYEAARIDGASGWQSLWRITLPLLSPVLLFNVITSMILAFQYFVPPYLITGGGPADSTLVYGQYLYQNAFRYFRAGYASAMAWVLFLLIMIVTLALMRFSRRWTHYQQGS